jgi:GTP-binding protein
MEAHYVKSVTKLPDRPLPALPEFAFIGRSNCGKSSLLNHYLGRSRLAGISGRPGKTRALDYYHVDHRYYVVDLPGYGFARISPDRRRAWARLIRAYLAAGDRPLAAFHLLDVRREPSDDDVEMSGWLVASGRPFAVALTKTDKIGKSHLPARYQAIIAGLSLPSATPFFPTSARKGLGRKEMQAWVHSVLTAGTV